VRNIWGEMGGLSEVVSQLAERRRWQSGSAEAGWSAQSAASRQGGEERRGEARRGKARLTGWRRDERLGGRLQRAEGKVERDVNVDVDDSSNLPVCVLR